MNANGYMLLAWIVGLAVLAGCTWWAIATAPVEPGEYSAWDERDGLPREAVEHEAKMNARAAELGYQR